MLYNLDGEAVVSKGNIRREGGFHLGLQPDTVAEVSEESLPWLACFYNIKSL